MIDSLVDATDDCIVFLKQYKGLNVSVAAVLDTWKTNSSICTTSLTTYTAQLTIYMMRTSMRSIERGLWSGEEHDRFLMGLKLYPHGPWRKIAGFVGTRSPRQVQTHAQKYYEKVGRRLRGLRKDRKKLVRPEHRLDEDMVQLCQLAKERVDPNGHVDPTLTRLLRAPLSSSTQRCIT
ncbi:myb-like dna-binding [Plasmopara halstedii]|uniref:Myb-like dna-binding n=1 Tax=Plasmopara halstedii TaxID=4781 RepID=A0A0P1AV09_PLAHL|nr:myb-like dna-binding [Plasmopara halstedii]CEG46141.1 myb-like dna-binding [Plasmopara halstedii]|eukprot:XP_024582510.1 myb-like dna-binding [Plasmopara halstedii]